jgi:xylitol oxidase
MKREHNWADNYTFKAARIHRPTSADELRRLVRGSRNIRALGTRHSFNGIADSSGDLIDLANLDPGFAIDRQRQTVTVGAATHSGTLASHLQRQGLALHNMGSLPHISVGGATATGTHGSGDRNGNLSTAVAALELVTTNGDLIEVHRGDDGFDGMVVGLGAFGVVIKLTLDFQPSFDPTAAHLGATATQHPYWSSHDGPTDQLNIFGIPGPWSERLPHFRLDSDPGPGEQLQSEYMVPRRQAAAALSRLRAIGDRIDWLLYITEIRTVAADALWLSPSYGQDTVAIHFTWKKQPAVVDAITAGIEEMLLPLGARPHWGKLLHATANKLAQLYPRLPEFRALAESYDPDGKFRNEFLVRHVFGQR